MSTLTPMMRQYLDIKESNKDAILFFRMGDFYEMFFEDAKVASNILSITLTSRDKNKDGGIPMCGIPYHAALSYIPKLLKEGHKVAICEQVEDAKDGKGIVKREVTRVITPGIPLDEGLIEAKNNNYLSSVFIGNKDKKGLAFMDVSTGEFKLTEIEGWNEFLSELNKIEPKEVLLSEGLKDSYVPKELSALRSSVLFTYLEDSLFDYQSAKRYLMEHYQVASLNGFGCSHLNEAVRAAGALLHYIRETQKQKSVHIKAPLPYYNKDFMILDSNTLQNLELIKSIKDGTKKGSLLWAMDRTRTAMGGRKIKECLLFPLTNISEIKKRQDAIGALVGESRVREDLQEKLKEFYDLERIIAKLSLLRVNPRDIVALKDSLKKVPEIKAILEPFESILLREVYTGLEDLSEPVHLIDTAIMNEPPVNIKDGGFIRDGYSRNLDELRDIKKNSRDWIVGLENGEKKRTGIASLKIRYNRVFGYYIEVTKANLSLVPDNYIRKQTLVNAERFITPELKEYEDKVLSSQERIVALEQSIFQDVREEVSRFSSRIQKIARCIGILDYLLSLAQIADERDYSRPLVTDETGIAIRDGRHPVVETLTQEGFVPNDTFLDGDGDEGQIIILTGPNMAGKSTYMRQVALIVIMAQMGSFVPADDARIGLADRVFTRVGAMDDISRGQSTFMVEMSEVANILHHATSKSLIILDEVGRGTSTFDGVSIAWAIAEFIHDHPSLKARTLFATHYHELTELALTKERVKNYNILVKEWNDRIIFLRKVAKGGVNRSYGIQVARLAGLPGEVLERAREILHNLEGGELDEKGLPRIASSSRLKRRQSEKPQLSLFGKEVPTIEATLRDEIKGMDLNSMTPLEAMNMLDHLKKLVS